MEASHPRRGLFTILNLTWIGAMLHDVGGWERYRDPAAEFGYEAGAMNSIWNLGWFDGPVRYAIKLGMGLVWTLGPALIFVPRGFARLMRLDQGGFLVALIGTQYDTRRWHSISWSTSACPDTVSTISQP